jgi:hypothetical protein
MFSPGSKEPGFKGSLVLILGKRAWVQIPGRTWSLLISTGSPVQLDWFSKSRVVCGLPVIHAPEVKDSLGSFKKSKGISPVLDFKFFLKLESLGLNGAQPLLNEYNSSYTPLAVVSHARKTTRINHCYDSANSGCFVERGHCDRRCTRHAKIPSLTSDTYE